MPIEIFGDYVSDCLGMEWSWEYIAITHDGMGFRKGWSGSGVGSKTGSGYNIGEGGYGMGGYNIGEGGYGMGYDMGLGRGDGYMRYADVTPGNGKDHLGCG